MNEGYCSNSTNLININRKKKRDLKILRENRQERREEEEEEEEEKRGENKGKRKGVGGNKFKDNI